MATGLVIPLASRPDKDVPVI